MKGVVRPQAMPIRRKPRVERNREGEEVWGEESIWLRNYEGSGRDLEMPDSSSRVTTGT